MTVFLLPHVHAAQVGDDLVLLNVRGDAYLCVRGGVRSLRPSRDLRRLSPRDPDAETDLVSAGLVVGDAPTLIAPPLPALPRRDLGDVTGPAATARDLLRLVQAIWDLVASYRGRGFAEIMAFAAAGAPPEGAGASAEAVRLAQLFSRLAVWLPMPRQCLVRSFVLLRFLHHSGCRADWVIGVRTWPFAAHCWLQRDDLALDDAFERLAHYHPIVAVRA